MDFEAIIREFSSDHDIYLSDKTDIYKFVIDDQYELFIQKSDDSDCFAIHSIIGEIPENSKEKIYSFLLESNFFGKNTGKGTIAIDPKSNKIVIFIWLDQKEITYEKFHNEVKLLIENVKKLREQIKTLEWSK